MSASDPLKATLARSYSGALVDLVQPDWHDINLNDVARGLSQINRWNGQTSRAVSVLEHSQVVAGMVKPALKLAARLHDAHEFIIGDGVRPFIAALAEKAGGGTIRRDNEAIKLALDIAICRQLFEQVGIEGVNLQIEAEQLAAEMRSPIVKSADDLAGKIEERQFFGGSRAEKPTHYSDKAPDLSLLVTEWLAAIVAECRERFGVGDVGREGEMRRLGRWYGDNNKGGV